MSSSVTLGPKGGRSEYKCHIIVPDQNIHIQAFLPENFSASFSSDYDMPFANGVSEKFTTPKIRTAIQALGLGTSTQLNTIQIWQGTAPVDFSIPMQFLLDDKADIDVLAPLRALMRLYLPEQIAPKTINELQSSSGSLQGIGGFLRAPGPKLTLKGQSPTASTKDRLVSVLEYAKEEVEDVASFLADIVEQETDGILEYLAGGTLFRNLHITNNIMLSIGHFMIFPSVVITNIDAQPEIKLERRTRKPIAMDLNVGFRTFLTPKQEDVNAIIPSITYGGTL